MAANEPGAQRNPTSGCSPLAYLRATSFFRWLDDNYNDVIVVVMALVAVFAGAVAYLETWSGNHYATTVRQGQTLAMDALGYDTSSRQRENYDFFLYTTWNEWDWRRSRASGVDPAQAEMAIEVSDIISPLTPLLDESQAYFDPDSLWTNRFAYHVDTNLITTTMLLEQRAFTIETANIWNGKADGYVTVLTVIAVALFLYGLSTTLSGGLRHLFAGVGSLLVFVALVSTLNLTLRPVPEVPDEAIAAYARGLGRSYLGEYDKAIAAYDQALQAYPDYANAYFERGEARFWQWDYAGAVEDYRRAIAAGRDDRSVNWEMGWALHLTGDYQGALAADRRALELDPSLVPVVMNTASTLLVSRDTEAAMLEIERGLAMAADPNTPVPAAWNQQYLREAVNDLDRLLAALDGQTGFFQEPDLSHVADRDTLRAAAEAARLRIKEGAVSLQVSSRSQMERTTASLSPITFARYVGRDGALVGRTDTFSRGEYSVVASLSHENLPSGALVSRRVVWAWSDEPGAAQALPTMGQDFLWQAGPQGTWQHVMEAPWPGDRGLRPGRYIVEYYVNGQLLQSDSFAVPDEDTPVLSAIVFGTECGSGGIPYGQANVFPAGAAKVTGVLYYSGLEAGGQIRAQWTRDGAPYSVDALSTETSWGSHCYDLHDLPPGGYTLELTTEGQEEVHQSGSFEVLALDEYLQRLGHEPGDWRFHFDLGQAYANAGLYQEAAARYENAVEIEPECAECYYEWWAALEEGEDYQQAIDKLQKAIELNPAQYDYLAALGSTYYKLGDEKAATDAFRQAIPANPARVYNEWGNALFDHERYDEAVKKYQQSVELNPDDEVVYANLGSALRKLDQYDEAEAALEQAVAINPQYARAYNLWGDTLYAQEQYIGAASKYQQAIDADPDFALYHSNLGWAYYKAGMYVEAAAAFQQAVEVDPTRATDFNKWGDSLYAQGLYAEAVEQYAQAVALWPEQPLYHSNLAWAYLQLGDNEAASASFQRAVELDPENSRDWNMWGRALYLLEDYSGAAEKHQRAVDLSPDIALYHYNLAWALYQLQETDRAIAEFERAVELAALAGDEELQQDAEEVLQQLR